MKGTVIFDMDDTSGNLKERTEMLYRNITGDETICMADWTDYHVKDRYGVGFDQLGDAFIQDESLQRMKPHEGLVEITTILKALDYNVEFVTARAWHPEGFDITKKWLDDNQVCYDRINIVGLHECKEEVTRHIENIKLFVDDRDDHCASMLKSGRVEKALLFAQPWNAMHHIKHPDTKVIRIDSLYEVLHHI